MAKKKKKEEAKPGAPAWMASYSDMMSLLLCFFVMLYAMSDLNEEMLIQFLASFGNQNISLIQENMSFGMNNLLGSGILEMPLPPETTPAQDIIDDFNRNQEDMRSIRDDFLVYFADNNLSDQVDVTMGPDYVLLSFSDMLFESGSATLTPSILYVVDHVGEEVGRLGNHNIRIEGHTDNIPINTVMFRSNWYLSAARAISVAERFTVYHGISPARIEPQGFGEHRPIATNDTPEGRALNRRVEIRIMSN